MQGLAADRFDFSAGIKQRKVPPLGPHLEEVRVMWPFGIAALAGAVRGEGRVPVSGVDDDPKRPAGGLVVAVAGVVNRVTISPARKRPHIQLRLPFGFDGGA